MSEILPDETFDQSADEEIAEALTLSNLQSFFLYAGAGSGKTRSLVDALNSVNERFGRDLRRKGKQVGVITYTNAACEEILRRVFHDPLFHVATIHSFAWTLIGGRNTDIRQYLKVTLPKEISEIEEQEAKGRSGKASTDRQRKIQSKRERLQSLDDIKHFTYDPDGDNFEKDALTHDEVIKITAKFISEKPALKKILSCRYPILLIDESQDTMRGFMEALLAFEEEYKGRFALGLFGDTMQRIYGHGKKDLAKAIPPRWKQPEKVMNHRSKDRIIRFANAIRAQDDGWRQRPRRDREGGIVRAYIAQAATTNKPELEQQIREDMAEQSADQNWALQTGVKQLILEHHMAASRLGFPDLFFAFNGVEKYATGFKDGTLPGLRLFTERVTPLITAQAEDDAFETMRLLREYSPLVSKATFASAGPNIGDALQAPRNAVEALKALFSDNNPAPSLGQILSVIKSTQIFPIPEMLQPFAEEAFLSDLKSYEDAEEKTTQAWAKALQCPWQELIRYSDYTHDRTSFATHQGVKGLEFERVFVIVSDADMRFKAAASYEKLFGAKELTSTDKKKQKAGEEIGIDRTRRLLYVTATRAEESLAIVIYTAAPDKVKTTLKTQFGLQDTEIKKV